MEQDKQLEVKKILLKRLGYTDKRIEEILTSYDVSNVPIEVLCKGIIRLIDAEKKALDEEKKALNEELDITNDLLSGDITIEKDAFEREELRNVYREELRNVNRAIKADIRKRMILREPENPEVIAVIQELMELKKKNKPYLYYYTEDSINRLIDLGFFNEENSHYVPYWRDLPIPKESRVADAIAGPGTGAYLFYSYHWCRRRREAIACIKGGEPRYDYDTMGKVVRYFIDNNAITKKNPIKTTKAIIPGPVKNDMIVKGYLKKAEKGWYYVDLDSIDFEY